MISWKKKCSLMFSPRYARGLENLIGKFFCLLCYKLMEAACRTNEFVRRILRSQQFNLVLVPGKKQTYRHVSWERRSFKIIRQTNLWQKRAQVVSTLPPFLCGLKKARLFQNNGQETELSPCRRHTIFPLPRIRKTLSLLSKDKPPFRAVHCRQADFWWKE